MSRIPPEFTVTIPADRIAQHPAPNREEAKLLIFSRRDEKIVHIGTFCDIVSFIAGDLVVVNDTRVVPARVRGTRPGGGKLELLFVDVGEEAAKQALISPGRRLRTGMELALPGDTRFVLRGSHPVEGWIGEWIGGESFHKWLQQFGEPPLPPYIKRIPESGDRDRYQTVYAENPGSLAAPTAGFHFTKPLIEQLTATGCSFVPLTLTVGLGTFQPIRADDISQHKMHRENYYIPPASAAAINEAFDRKRRITAVGTTSVRALEAAAQKGFPLLGGADSADIFIYPPYSFWVVDRVITNFHRPDSTLLQLIAAIIGWNNVNLTYAAAVDHGFRFFSYGDSMAII